MLTLQTKLDELANQMIYDSLLHTMENHLSDFAEIKQKYLMAMDSLQNELGEPAVAKEKDAIRQQIASTLFFSFYLGIQANLHDYLNPVSGNFLNTEPEIYLQEQAAAELPEYAAAQKTRQAFYAGLTDAQKTRYESITEYTCYWDTAGPKLAHYYGFCLGNTLLQRVVPGYYPNMALTLRYRMMLKEYFGTDADWCFLLKFPLSTGGSET